MAISHSSTSCRRQTNSKNIEGKQDRNIDMAGYNRSEQKTHAFNQILKDMKTGAVKSACLLCGTEQFLVNWAKDQLIKKNVSEATKTMDLVVFEAGEFDMERLKEACDTMPLFSERKVVVLENFDAVWGKTVKNVTSYVSEICDLIRGLPEQTMLVITAGEDPEPKKKDRPDLYRTVRECGSIYDFKILSERDLKKFIMKRLRGLGKGISSRALDTLISSSGYYNKDIDYALYNLENDVKKIVALTEGDEITENDVINGISDNIEHAVFKMLDAISQNRKDTAFRLLNDMLRSGEPAMRILAVITGQLELMLEVRECLSAGMNQNAIPKAVGAHEFRVQKAAKFSSGYSEKELRRILVNAFETDVRIKSGILDEKLALEMLIAEI